MRVRERGVGVGVESVWVGVCGGIWGYMGVCGAPEFVLIASHDNGSRCFHDVVER